MAVKASKWRGKEPRTITLCPNGPCDKCPVVKQVENSGDAKLFTITDDYGNTVTMTAGQLKFLIDNGSELL